jgi:hypothetical protein
MRGRDGRGVGSEGQGRSVMLKCVLVALDGVEGLVACRVGVSGRVKALISERL